MDLDAYLRKAPYRDSINEEIYYKCDQADSPIGKDVIYIMLSTLGINIRQNVVCCKADAYIGSAAARHYKLRLSPKCLMPCDSSDVDMRDSFIDFNVLFYF